MMTTSEIASAQAEERLQMITVRLPRQLHRRLKQEAHRCGAKRRKHYSMNQLCLDVLEAAVADAESEVGDAGSK